MMSKGGRAAASAGAVAVSAGSLAPAFALHDSPHSRIALEDLRGRAVVLVFYVADWHPVAVAQLAVYQELLPHLERLDATLVGISVDATWSHHEFARATGIAFPLLSDDSPPGEVARRYGVYVPDTGRSRRALFVLDATGIVRWYGTYPDAVDPGADGVLSALEGLRPTRSARDDTNMHDGTDHTVCACGCGLSAALTGKYAQPTSSSPSG
jgi:peroxiredoxin